MTSPTRRPIKLRNYHGRELEALNQDAAFVNLGFSYLHEELNAAGWPSRTPEDDRKYRPPVALSPEDLENAYALDYSDPAGEMALRYDRMHEDLIGFQDDREQMRKLRERIVARARKYQPPHIEAIPACTHAACTDPVEARRLKEGGLSYVGMVLVGGTWAAKPGATPLCSRHRKQQARRAS